MSIRCTICQAYNPDGEMFCTNCGQQLRPQKQNEKQEELVQINESELDLQLREEFLGENARYKQYQSFANSEDTSKPSDDYGKRKEEREELFDLMSEELYANEIAATYKELINVIVEDAKNLSFVVAGTTEGNAADLLKEREKKWIHLFLNSRPEQLNEDSLIASPQAVGELEVVFEKARDSLKENKHNGAKSIIEDFLKVIRQIKDYAAAPSQTSR